MKTDRLTDSAGLLVSVRSAEEAAAALLGGAAVIDVKEPARGSLGWAGGATVRAVVGAVAGRRPVSAALGELGENPAAEACPGLAFVKWGLAGWAGRHWQREWLRAAEPLPAGCRPVVVAYADCQRAETPRPADVCGFAPEVRPGAFLLDTWRKDGTTLLDWLPLQEVEALCRRCRAAAVPVALAGSLGPDQIRTLVPLRPNWFAVRGAACREGRRDAGIDTERVRSLVALLRCG